MKRRKGTDFSLAGGSFRAVSPVARTVALCPKSWAHGVIIALQVARTKTSKQNQKPTKPPAPKALHCSLDPQDKSPIPQQAQRCHNPPLTSFHFKKKKTKHKRI